MRVSLKGETMVSEAPHNNTLDRMGASRVSQLSGFSRASKIAPPGQCER
jgi:hypothetical protein